MVSEFFLETQRERARAVDSDTAMWYSDIPKRNVNGQASKPAFDSASDYLPFCTVNRDLHDTFSLPEECLNFDQRSLREAKHEFIKMEKAY